MIPSLAVAFLLSCSMQMIDARTVFVGVYQVGTQTVTQYFDHQCPLTISF